jgi:hypothetical protein
MKAALLACCMCALAASALAGGLRDPTRPPLRAAAGVHTEPVPVLSAVYSGVNGRRSAIVNGEVVHDGSAVGPFQIEAVLADGVRYRYDGRALELRLPRTLDMIKKPTIYPARATSGVKP